MRVVGIKPTVRFLWMEPTFWTRWVRLVLRFILQSAAAVFACLSVFTNFSRSAESLYKDDERERERATVCLRLIDVCLLEEKSTTKSLWYFAQALLQNVFSWGNMSKMVDHNGLLQNDQNTFVVKYVGVQGYKKCWIQHTMALQNSQYKTHL